MQHLPSPLKIDDFLTFWVTPISVGLSKSNPPISAYGEQNGALGKTKLHLAVLQKAIVILMIENDMIQ